MAFDAHKNFAMSAVVTPPSPPTTGASLTVTTGEGALFPAAPFNAIVCPPGVLPSAANAEIVRVTARSGDVLTITRAQEGSVARAVVVGDLCVASITAKALQDLETAPFARTDAGNIFAATQTISGGGVVPALFLQNTGSVANARQWKLLAYTDGDLYIQPADDAGAGAPGLIFHRNGDFHVAADIYEKQRTAPIGQWIAVPFNAANFVGVGGMTWTVGSGNVAVNHYMLSGNTLFWNLIVTGTSLTGTASNQIQCILPGGLVSASAGGSGSMPCAVIADSSGPRKGYVSLVATTAVGVLLDASANYALGGLNLHFTIILPLVG